MTTGFGWVAVAALALVPAAGAVQAAGPPPNGGTISIDAKAVDGMSDASMPAFVDAASSALTARGFTVFDDAGHAASAVELIVSRSDVGTGLSRVPGQKAAAIMGAGVAVPLGTGESELVRLRRTRLEWRIHRRGETGVVWDGVAVTVRETGAAKSTDSAVASDLTRALLQSYPAVPKDVVGVP